MGYFKTLTIDPSAAREYSQRWAQNDQVEKGEKRHLVSGRGSFKNTTTVTIAAAMPVQQTQNDQVEECRIPHLAGCRGSFNNTTATTQASAVPLQETRNDQAEGRIHSHPVTGHEVRYPMTTSTVSEFLNPTREHVGRALHAWRKNVEHNPRDLNALNRASLNLEACPWYMSPDGELVITSASDSRKRYHVNVDGCDCRAATSGRPCWHVAAYRILHTAEAMRRYEASQKGVQRDMEQVQVLVDELV